MILNLTLISLLLLFFLGRFYYANLRLASDVHLDLVEDTEIEITEAQAKPKSKEKLLYLGILLSILIYFFFNIISAVISFCAIVIARRFVINRQAQQRKMLIARILPLTMERLVMTIEAGNDVLSACRIIVDQDKASGQKANLAVSKHLESVLNLAESGQSFTESLKQVSQQLSGTALAQTFIHLSLAYSQGGELVEPLRELSDATQLAYQETVEEEIAKLPVKATLPLLLLFAGLILFFITPPLLEVQKLTTNVQVEV